MNEPQAPEDRDDEVRRRVYDRVMTTGKAPLIEEVAGEMGISAGEVRESFQRMSTAHVLVLQPGSGEVLMANPFSAVPTAFVVRSRGVDYWGNCIWDALGVVAMLHRDALIETGCGDCNEAMTLEIKDEALAEAEGIIHFSVPARRWWDNITFT